MVKIFVVDTNVLLHEAGALNKFQDNDIVLPITVIEELDDWKNGDAEINRNARSVIRFLDRLRSEGSLLGGTKLDSGGILRIELNNAEVLDTVHPGLNLNKPDNRILAVAYNLKIQEDKKGDNGKKVVIVSKDFKMRVCSDAIGVETGDFTAGTVVVDDLYQGWSKRVVSGNEIDRFFEGEHLSLEKEPCYNEFVVLEDENNLKHTAVVRRNKSNKLEKFITAYDTVYGVASKNVKQRMALELLMDPEVELVTITGQAGTGKTLLAIAAALECTINAKRYDKVLVSRPIIPMGKDIGYLPGGKDAKMSTWMQPIFDNLSYLINKNKGIKKRCDEKEEVVQKEIDCLFKKGIVDIEALAHIRGRSIPRQFMIIDEAQNLTPHEVKTIISRAGEGTKIVLTGDVYQIDNPYLDSASNGLAYTVERLKEQAIVGHVTLEKTERSSLAAVAAKYL